MKSVEFDDLDFRSNVMVDYYAMKFLRECISESDDFVMRECKKSACTLI